jgi:hypothetical protein
MSDPGSCGPDTALDSLPTGSSNKSTEFVAADVVEDIVEVKPPACPAESCERAKSSFAAPRSSTRHSARATPCRWPGSRPTCQTPSACASCPWSSTVTWSRCAHVTSKARYRKASRRCHITPGSCPTPVRSWAKTRPLDLVTGRPRSPRRSVPAGLDPHRCRYDHRQRPSLAAVA